MGTWNHRVVRKSQVNSRSGETEYWYGIHEAHYENLDDDENPHAITMDEVSVSTTECDTPEEALQSLRWTLEHMIEALNKPILDYTTRKPI